MGDVDDNIGIFNHIIGDMKNMAPLWEDLLLKASKFYAAIKQTAITGDLFLEAFQKVADATTNSKGSTRDIGVAFTKIVMRHKAIESKLKTYVGILADNFVSPLQECLDEWKRSNSQLEKDHTKDYKRLKSELKRANSDAAKMKKKASKKMGKQEYTDQYREAMKIANLLAKALEEQEKAYLRKIMTDERERASQFFNFFKPCVMQELTMISEIEQLESIIEETSKLCSNPTQLPPISEDVINNFKLPDALTPGSRDNSTAVSPPSSPILVRDRTLNQVNIPMSHKGTLSRSHTLPNYMTEKDPIPVSIPTPTWSTSTSESVSSSHSSLSSLEQNAVPPLHDPITLQELRMSPSGDPDDQCINGHSVSTSNNHQDHHANDIVNMHAVLRTRSSWSSSETSDSSGIGSYHSLNSSQQHRFVRSASHRSGSETDVIEADYLDNYDERSMFPPPPPLTVAPGYHGYQQYQQSNSQKSYPPPSGFHQYSSHSSHGSRDHTKYATIDRSHFRRNQFAQQHNFQETLKQRSNSLGENNDEDFPASPEYKMNLPKSKMNTISGTRTLPTNARQTIFQVFDGYDPSMLLKKLSPTNSPYKKAPPPTPQRRSSTPLAPQIAPKPSTMKERSKTLQYAPRRSTVDNEPCSAKPGSFEASLQQQRLKIKQRSMSVDQSSSIQYQDATKF